VVLVLLDDMQWLDEASIAFLHYALRLLGPPSPVWFAGTPRQRELEANLPADRLLQALHRDQRLCSVELAALNREQTRALAQAIGCAEKGDRIFTSSGGNPLFALELARAQPRPITGRPKPWKL
jgi:predicted ATPase